MKETFHVARKQHKCDSCSGFISKGQTYCLSRYRFPVYEQRKDGEDGRQIGIFYESFKSHTHRCYLPKSCQDGNHKFKDFGEHYEEDDIFSGVSFDVII